MPRSFSLHAACALVWLGGLAAVAAAQDAPSLPELMRRASDQIQQEEFAAAAKTLRKVVEADGEMAQAWQLLGYSLHLDGQLDEAIKAHAKAAEFEATKGVALYNLGCAYALKKQADKAFGYLDQALAAGFDNIQYFETDTDLDSLRRDARFTALVQRLKGEDVPAKFDAARLIGTWSYAEGVRAGEKVTPERLMGEVKITKETFTLPAGPSDEFVMAYQLDAKKDPVAIDLEIKSGPVDEGQAKGVIRIVDENTIQLCYNPMGEKRPEKFESTAENGFFLFTLKRKP